MDSEAGDCHQRQVHAGCFQRCSCRACLLCMMWALTGGGWGLQEVAPPRGRRWPRLAVLLEICRHQLCGPLHATKRALTPSLP